MFDVLILILALALLPLIVLRTDKNGLLLCKLSFVVIFLIIALAVVAIIVKIKTGEFIFFNLLMIPIQGLNIFSFSKSYMLYKRKRAKQKERMQEAKDIVV